MARKYKRITYQDRKEMQKMFKNNLSYSVIAQIIGVDKVTVCREKKRGWNEVSQLYEADLAQQRIGNK